MNNVATPLAPLERLTFLRARLNCRRPRRTTLFVVPWINVSLLLFIFYVAQSQRVLSPGINLTLPESSFAGGAPVDAEVISVLRNGAIFLRDQRVSNERLVAELRAARSSSRPTLLLEADGEVPHKMLAHVYNAAREAGYRDIVLATRLPDAGAPATAR